MSRNVLGNAGELFVINYLQRQGFCIKAHNYRKFFGEIDIIACKNQLYIFVEVKTRRSATVVMGELITVTKQQKIIKTALSFIMEHSLQNYSYRFDVALVMPEASTFSMHYIPHAFSSSQGYYE